MTIADTINGSYEMLGGVALAWNCVTTYRDKEIKGISLSAMVFFTSWGGLESLLLSVPQPMDEHPRCCYDGIVQ